MIFNQLMVCLLLAATAFAESGVFESKKAQADVSLTADPDSRFWKDTPRIVVTTDYAGKPVPNNRMEARSRWTSGNLYILYICDFDELTLKSNPSTTEETNKLWDWDVAEAFLGSDFNDIARYKEFQVSPQGEWVDLDIDRSPQKRGAGITWNSGFEVKARIDQAKKVWYGEMKIPFEKLGVNAPADGTKIRVGIYRCAGREPDRKLISWQQTGVRSFHVPERFGILMLKQ
jgi:cellulose/xylan binding protein with CBM9 domain